MKLFTKNFIISLSLRKSYSQYLDQVIQNLIHRQDCVVEKTCSAPELGSAQYSTYLLCYHLCRLH